MEQNDDFPRMRRMSLCAKLCELLQMAGYKSLDYIHWDDAIGGVMVKDRYKPTIRYMLAGKKMKDIDLIEAVIERVRSEYK